MSALMPLSKDVLPPGVHSRAVERINGVAGQVAQWRSPECLLEIFYLSPICFTTQSGTCSNGFRVFAYAPARYVD
jgi:hypothetical protein